MKVFLLPLIILNATISFAQDCTPGSLKDKPGNWKAGTQGSIHNVTANDLAKEKAMLTDLQRSISNNYKPSGCQVSYSMVFGKEMGSASNWIADPYHLAMYILRYLCKENKPGYYVEYSSPTNVDITANVIFSLNNLYAAELPADDMRGYLRLARRPEKVDGVYYLGEEATGDNGNIHEYRWLVTYGDELPFYYVSRKEYLTLLKAKLNKDIKESPGEKEYFEKFINKIAEYLGHSESELSDPAVCMWNDEERFNGFVAEGTKGSFLAVKPAPGYYKKNLPKSAPQFFTVVYTLSKGDPVFEENIANIRKAIDLTALRNLLGK
jgi:hypothetical protein